MDRLGLATVEVHRAAMARFNRRLQRRMAKTVWATGCASWYLDAHGRNTTLWPRLGVAFRATTRRFDLDAYRITLRPSRDRCDRPRPDRSAGERVQRPGRRHHRRRFRNRPGVGPPLATDGARLAISDVDPLRT